MLDVIRRFDGNSELYDFFSRYTSMQKFIEMAYKENDFEKVDKYIDGFNNNLAKVYEGKSKEAISGFNDVLDDIIGEIEEDTKAKLDEIKKIKNNLNIDFLRSLNKIIFFNCYI